MPRQKKSSVTKSSQKRSKYASKTSPKPRKKKQKNYFSWPKIIFVVGVLFVGISLIYHIQQTIQLTFYHQQLPPVSKNRLSRPVEIVIDKVDIDLPIVETVIANNTWQIADDGISHLALSGRPGENNTIILYGHNTNDRFGPIRWLSVGDTIKLTTANNKTYTYKIQKTTTVDPNNTKILTSQKGSTLVLYTCTGFADLQRYVLIAKPTK